MPMSLSAPIAVRAAVDMGARLRPSILVLLLGSVVTLSAFLAGPTPAVPTAAASDAGRRGGAGAAALLPAMLQRAPAGVVAGRIYVLGGVRGAGRRPHQTARGEGRVRCT